MATVAGVKPHPIYLAGRGSSRPTARGREPGPPGRAGRGDVPRDASSTSRRSRPPSRRSRSPGAARVRARPDLREISAGISARREELGALIAPEAGKPIRDALAEVDRATLTFRLGAEEAERHDRRDHPARPHPGVQGPGRHHAAVPDRADRGHQPVQLPAQPRGAQGRAGDRLGQPDRAQAAVQGPARRCSRSRRSSRRPGSPTARCASCR